MIGAPDEFDHDRLMFCNSGNRNKIRFIHTRKLQPDGLEVDDRANLWAAVAAKWGLEDGATVATMPPASIECFSAWIGLARARLLEASVSTDFQGRC